MSLRRIFFQFAERVSGIFHFPNLYRDTLFLASSSLIGGLGGFLFWKIATNIYSPEVVGIGAAAISSATYLASVGNLGLTNGAVRFLPSMLEGDRSFVTTFMQGVSIVSALVCVLIFVWGRSFWAHAIFPDPLDTPFVVIFGVLALLLTVSNILTSMFQAARHVEIMPLWNIASYTLQIAGILLLPHVLGEKSIVLSVAIQNGITLFLLYHWAVRFNILDRIEFHFKWSTIGEIMEYSLASQIFGVLWSLPAFILPLFVLSTLGAESNAGFVLAWMIYSMIYIFPSSLSLGMLIEGSHSPEHLITQWRQALILSIVILIPLAIILALLADWILSLFGGQYRLSATLLQLLVISSIPLSFNALLMTSFRVQKRNILLNVSMSVLILLSLSGAWIGITYMQLDGLGWGWLTGQTLFSLCALPYFLKKQFSEKETSAWKIK